MIFPAQMLSESTNLSMLFIRYQEFTPSESDLPEGDFNGLETGPGASDFLLEITLGLVDFGKKRVRSGFLFVEDV